MTRAEQTANLIAERMKTEINDSKMRVRVWVPEGASFARVYTGLGRGDYVQVEADGTAAMSSDRMAWSHVIRDIITTEA